MRPARRIVFRRGSSNAFIPRLAEIEGFLFLRRVISIRSQIRNLESEISNLKFEIRDREFGIKDLKSEI